ncbi:MAG TPA: hypothetical protein VGK97_14290, partial [Spongiibacteraceae bacterium]
SMGGSSFIAVGEAGMAAVVESFQQFFWPLLLIGVCTGVVALIPAVGWILGILIFILSLKYTRRTTLSLDLMITMALWILIRGLAMQLHIA